VEEKETVHPKVNQIQVAAKQKAKNHPKITPVNAESQGTAFWSTADKSTVHSMKTTLVGN
jgi:hypothetical protein